jgi:hypothetical protein
MIKIDNISIIFLKVKKKYLIWSVIDITEFYFEAFVFANFSCKLLWINWIIMVMNIIKEKQIKNIDIIFKEYKYAK